MNPNVAPHKFACQPGRHLTSTKERVLSEKRARQKDIAKYLQSAAAAGPSTETFEPQLVEVIEVEHEQLPEPLKVEIQQRLCDKACQTKQVHFRSKSVQIPQKRKVKDAVVSPIKFPELDKQTSKPPKKRLRLENERTNPESSTVTETSESDSYEAIGSSTESSNSEADQLTAKIEQSNIRELFINIIKKNLRLYTGIPVIYADFIEILHKQTGLQNYYIYITLYKIRTNDSFEKIGHLFGISKTCASEIFTKSIFIMEPFMKELIFWPTECSIRRNLPISFRLEFSQVQSIIDCLEIQIQKPANALQQSLTWSEYKKCNTVKYLISSTPDGLINFISVGYGGRVSDAALFEDCKFLDILPDHSTVMADRGFKQIETLLNKKGCTLVRPPSVAADEKMSKEDVILTKRIASVRIHIERVIKRIRDFKMLAPHAVIGAEIIQKLDSAITVACAIINLQQPIINQGSL
ncbi:hypothetical protein RI129_001185 [Pyrocoelia pectoralis]|uniref:DDE Tnp4 domain-containing protein n=1 Tax=Pyrocoelia pectoralis TaxID=417401 RepID=A0AAN7VT42_9COLE